MSSVTCPACNFVNEGSDLRHCSKCGGFLPAAPAGDETTSDPLVGQVILNGKYRIVSIIGEGGMGKVYLAEQKLGTATRKVAIKTLQPDLAGDPQIVARFHRETQTVIELEHPNTIKFYDFGELAEHGKKLFVVMEFIQGESLAHRLARGPLDLAATERIMSQVCGSLAEAHEKGIVHRDLKPENIYLTQKGARGDFVKVLDFGIAKRNEAQDDREAKLTRQGMVLGTPPYMSPEQFTGQALDGRSDVYALGVITYEMLTGQLPFTAQTPWEWATKHLTAAPTPIETQPNGASLPQRMRDAILRSLKKNRDERQKTVIEFLHELTGSSEGATDWTASSTSLTNAGNKPSQPTPVPVAPTLNAPMGMQPGGSHPGGGGQGGVHPANTPNPFVPSGSGPGHIPSPSNAGFAAVPPSMGHGAAGSNPSFPSPVSQAANPFGPMPSQYGQQSGLMHVPTDIPTGIPAAPAQKSNTGVIVGVLVGVLVLGGAAIGGLMALGSSGGEGNEHPSATPTTAYPSVPTAAYPSAASAAYPSVPTAYPGTNTYPTAALPTPNYPSAAYPSAYPSVAYPSVAYPSAYPSAAYPSAAYPSAAPSASAVASAAPNNNGNNSGTGNDDDDDPPGNNNNNNNNNRPAAPTISPVIANGVRMAQSGNLRGAIAVLGSNSSAAGAGQLRSELRRRGRNQIDNMVLGGQCGQAMALYGALRNVGVVLPADALGNSCQ